MNDHQFIEFENNIGQMVWDCVWSELDGVYEINTVLLGRLCHAAESSVKKELERWFDEDD